MDNIPVTKRDLENNIPHRKLYDLDLSFGLGNDTPNPMFQEMHKTVYSLINITFGISILIVLFIRLCKKNIVLDTDITGEVSALYCICYFCIQSKICHDIVEVEESHEMNEQKHDSESRRVYIVLSGCGSTFCMIVYLICCQLYDKYAYHFSGVFLVMAILLSLFSTQEIKTRRNYLFILLLGITYIFALILILK